MVVAVPEVRQRRKHVLRLFTLRLTVLAGLRRMVEAAIGKRVEITVWRNGALVDVIAVPRELTESAS